MPALAPGEARRLTPAVAADLRSPRIRVALRLGFFACGVALAGLAPLGCTLSPAQRAERADAAGRTGAFAWLRGHTPRTLVVSGTDAGATAALLDGARVVAAGAAPCAQAKRAHAAWLVVAPRSDARLRDRANDCGYALFHDDGALVIAPW